MLCFGITRVLKANSISQLLLRGINIAIGVNLFIVRVVAVNYIKALYKRVVGRYVISYNRVKCKRKTHLLAGLRKRIGAHQYIERAKEVNRAKIGNIPGKHVIAVWLTSK